MNVNDPDYTMEDGVVHGSGRYIERVSFSHRKHAHGQGKMPLTKLMRLEQRKGRESEKKFIQFVQSLIRDGKLPWALKVRRASFNQDKRFKFDAIIYARMNDPGKTTFPIPIQVKSSFGYAAKFKRNNPDCPAHIVVMNRNVCYPDKLIDVLTEYYENDLAIMKENVS